MVDLRRLQELIKIGAKVTRYAKYVTFQLAEVAVPRELFAIVLECIRRLWLPAPLPGAGLRLRSLKQPPPCRGPRLDYGPTLGGGNGEKACSPRGVQPGGRFGYPVDNKARRRCCAKDVRTILDGPTQSAFRTPDRP